MIDLGNYKEGDEIGTIYKVVCYFDTDGETITRKHEGCVLTKLKIDKDILEYEIRDNKGKWVDSYLGTMPPSTKIDILYLSLDEACDAFKKMLEEQIKRLTKQLKDYKNAFMFRLKYSFD